MQQLACEAEALVQRGWTRDGDGMGVAKTFHFKSYFKAIVSFLIIWASTSEREG